MPTGYTQYASGRETLPFSSSNITITSDGNLNVTGNYYLSIQSQNRCGLNLNSTPILITLTPTSKLTITLPTLLTSESEIQNFIISASITNDVTSLVQIASVNKADFNVPLILLSNDVFKLTTSDRTISTPSSLPNSSEQGIIKYITSLGYYYVYDKYATATVDNIQTLSATTGRWIRIGSINTYQFSTSIAGGCDQDVRTPNLTVDAPNYTCNGAKGEGVIFWIRNDYSTIIPSGTRISATVRLFEEDRSQLFEGLLIFEILGYVNLASYVLDTSTSTGELVYSAQDFLNLTEDLPSGSAVVVRVSPKFRPEFLDGIIPYLGNLTTYLTFSANTGVYAPGSAAYGNVIYAEYDGLKVVPNSGLSVTRLKGSGVIGSYELSGLSQETITGLIANTPDQYIFLTSNGTTFTSTTNPINGALIRAKVSTVNGISNPVNYGTIILDTTKQLNIVINYPTTIRSNYPDLSIVGNSNGIFNANYVEIYIKNSSNNYFVSEQIITSNSTSNTLTLDFNSFVSTTFPSNDSNFGLYSPTSVVLNSSSITSTFTSDTYTVYVAFRYVNQVTKIDHSVSDLTLATTKFSDIINSSNSWGSSLNLLDDARALTTAQLINGQSRFIFETFGIYTFNYSSTQSDNGTTVIKPTVLGTNPGAFVYTKSNTFLINNGIPTSGFGSLNDLCLDINTGLVYLKTNSTTWTSQGTLRTNFSNGTTAPISSYGNNGDLFLLTTTGDLYLKTSGSWSIIVNLKGDTGQNAFTTTTASFTQPAISSTVTVSVTNSSWLSVGQSIYISNGGYYSVNSITNATSIVVTNLGFTGNATVNSIITTAKTVSASGTIGATGSTGTSPTIGVGTVSTGSAAVTTSATTTGVNFNFTIPSAFTTVTSNYTQPAVNSTVSVSVNNTSWLAIGQIIYVSSAGYYSVNSISSGTVVVLTNLGYTGNASPTTVISSTRTVTAGGLIGATGAAGSLSAASSLTLIQQSSSPTTTSTQVALYVDNSASSLLKRVDPSSGTIKTIPTLNDAQQFTKTQSLAVNTLSISSGVVTVDLGASNLHTLSLTADITNFTASNLRTGTFMIYIIEDSTGGRTLTFDSSIFKFGLGSSTITTTANAKNILSCSCINSSTLECVLSTGF